MAKNIGKDKTIPELRSLKTSVKREKRRVVIKLYCYCIFNNSGWLIHQNYGK